MTDDSASQWSAAVDSEEERNVALEKSLTNVLLTNDFILSIHGKYELKLQLDLIYISRIDRSLLTQANNSPLVTAVNYGSGEWP